MQIMTTLLDFAIFSDSELPFALLNAGLNKLTCYEATQLNVISSIGSTHWAESGSLCELSLFDALGSSSLRLTIESRQCISRE